MLPIRVDGGIVGVIVTLFVSAQILAELWPFLDLVFVVRFCSITFEGMH